MVRRVSRLGKIALGAGTAAGLLAVFNGRMRWQCDPSPRWVHGEMHHYSWREGSVYYEVGGPQEAPPLLLLHGPGVAASSYEMRHLFADLVSDHRIYLPDLLGFGRSDRPAMSYTAETFIELWLDFCRDVIGKPSTVIAGSLSAAHIAIAAAHHPERFARLVFVNPSSTAGSGPIRALPRRLWRWLLAVPLAGTAAYHSLVSEPVLRHLIQSDIDHRAYPLTEQMLADYYVVSHQPGAKWAVAAFLSGRLDCDARQALASLRMPVQVLDDSQTHAAPVNNGDDFAARGPNITSHSFDEAGWLALEHQPDAILRLVRRLPLGQ